MKLLMTSLPVILLLPTLASAAIFEELKPLDAWIAEGGFEFLHDDPYGHCTETQDVSMICESTSTGCSPVRLETPNMIGGGMTMLRPLPAGTFANGFGLVHQHFTRVSENNSALPRDRLSFTHKVFKETVTFEGGTLFPDQTRDIDEFTLRLEKTFFDGRMSAEFILPWQHTTSPFVVASTNPSESTELGNLAFGLKYLLHRSERSAFSGGVLFEAPTSEDVVTDFGGLFTLRSQEAWHLTPYLAWLYEPGEAVYFHSFLSYRMPTTADGIFVPDTDFRSPNILMADASIGYWLIKHPNARFLTGLTSTLEFHYYSTTEPHEPPSNHWGQTDQLDLTVGMTAILRNQSTVTVGFSFPLRENHHASAASIQGPTDRLNDWTLMTQFNFYQW